MRLFTLIGVTFFVFGFVYSITINDASINDLEDQYAAETEALKEILEQFSSFEGIFTSCTACDTISRTIQDQEAMEYSKNYLFSYCDDMNKGIQKLCRPIIEKIFITGLDFLKKITIEEKCERFCELYERTIDDQFICDSILEIYDNAEFLTSVLETKVSSVCQTDTDPEKCFNEFKPWKPIILGFFQRSILRAAREVDDEEFCGIEISEIPRAEYVLSSPTILAENKNDSLACRACEYAVESVCEMITGPMNKVANIDFLCFVYEGCMKFIYKQSPGCDFLGVDDLPPDKQNCSTIANGADVAVFPMIVNVTNYQLWPHVCHWIDSKCSVNTNVPMCMGGVHH